MLWPVVNANFPFTQAIRTYNPVPPIYTEHGSTNEPTANNKLMLVLNENTKQSGST